jgi:basic amino acid/polyamine antiporter, APA family
VLNQTTSTVPTLRRELGRWDVTAIGVNQVIGSAVFVQPALLAALVGAWSPWLLAAVGIMSMLIALSFAEVSSRFESTGGPYLYARAAFGRFAAFEVGWMFWFTRVTSWAAVINVLATSIGFYWPVVTTGWPRTLLISAIIGGITWINVRGIRQSSFVVNVLTVGKLVPLVVVITIGLFAIDPARLVPDGAVTFASVSSAVLLLIFAFGGYEVVPVTAGETRDPRKTVPFALIMTIAIVSIVMTLVQIVTLGTLPDVSRSKTPLADAAATFLGAAGAALITIGAVFSTTGNNVGGAISGSRNMFALAEQGDLPAFFGSVHPRYRTPVTAILVTSAVTLALALSGTFARLALVSAVSRLVVYVFTCGATLRLRHPRFAAQVKPAAFVVPFGPIIPTAATLIALATLAGARREQLVAGAVALAVGAVLFVVATRSTRSKGQRL